AKEVTTTGVEGEGDGGGEGEGEREEEQENEESWMDASAVQVIALAFGVLKYACAESPVNQAAIRGSGLVEEALRFASDQALFVCSSPADMQAAMTVSRGEPAQPADVRCAVQAALQFGCNFVTGNDHNQALLWSVCFPRRLMELLHRLRSDRRLLSYAVAIIYNSVPPGLGMVGRDGGEGRLMQLVADRAFCCLLMQVVPARPRTGSNSTPDITPPGAQAPSAQGNVTVSMTLGRPGAGDGVCKGRKNSGYEISSDPAAEWLYLIFCRFLSARVVGSVYKAVGVRAGGRLARPNPSPDPRYPVVGLQERSGGEGRGSSS
ncbi:unnamed protein product, partial [Discosporangium mesarthrocarpum]